MLLPLATEPFTAPADRDMLPSERRTFVRTHRTCVYGYRRLHDGPAMSVVYYIPTDDDELLVSTMAGRGKTKAIARDGKVSLCILDEHWPFAYLQVYADATVERDRDLVVDVMMARRRADVRPAPRCRSTSIRRGDGRAGGTGCGALPAVRNLRPAAAASAPQRPGRADHPLGIGHHAMECTRPVMKLAISCP